MTDPNAPNHYEVLGVPFAATSAEIQRAYRAAMKRSHPDRQRGEAGRKRAEEEARLLNRAYATLHHPDRRRQYDQTIRAQEVQDQIMRRYVSGAMPGMGPLDGVDLRGESSVAARREQAQANRGALVSILAAFLLMAGVVVGLVLLYAVVDAVVRAVS